MEKAGRVSEEGGKCLGKVKQGKLSWGKKLGGQWRPGHQ